jgi:hypothetical protein
VTTAVLEATGASSQFIGGHIDEPEFRRRFPDLNRRLIPFDIPRELHVFLPKGCYERGHRLVEDFEVFRSEILRLEKADPVTAMGRRVTLHVALQRKVDDFTAYLHREYEKLCQ